VVQVVNQDGLTPADTFKLMVCICNLCVCVARVCLWQGALNATAVRGPVPAAACFMSCPQRGALRSDPACSSSVFITPGHFPQAVFSSSPFDEGEETHPE